MLLNGLNFSLASSIARLTAAVSHPIFF